MPTLDDRLMEAFTRAAAPVDGSGLFPAIDRRRIRAGRFRRMRVGIAAVAVILGTAGGLLVLNRAFERSDTVPARTPTIPTPAPSDVATAGCDAPSRATADVDGDGTPDHLRVHCSGAEGPWVLDVDWGNGASAQRPLTRACSSVRSTRRPTWTGTGRTSSPCAPPMPGVGKRVPGLLPAARHRARSRAAGRDGHGRRGLGRSVRAGR